MTKSSITTVFAISMALSIVLGVCNCTAVDMFGLRPCINADICLFSQSSWYAFCTAGSPELGKVSVQGALSDNDNASHLSYFQ
jgi:hypothetical protein